MAEFVNEEDARKAMEEIGVDEAGIELMSPKSVFKRILLRDVRNAIANIIKQEMLSLGGDAAVNRGCVNCTVERSDVLIMGTLKQLKGIVRKMRAQVGESKSIAKVIEELLEMTI